MKINKKYTPFFLGIAIAAGILIGGNLNFYDSSDKLFLSNSKKDKLNRLIDYIDYEYVDEVNTDSIVDVTVNGILENLDPHSVYIPKEDMQRVSENMKGDFIGIGISFYTYKDTITVIRSIKDGPSDRAGIKGGDRILMANGDSLFGTDIVNDQIVEKLKGPLNSKLNLRVYRKEENKFFDFTVKRDYIPLKSVDAAYMLSENLGYIKINRFAESTYKEFKKALDKLIGLGATELALDLRDNPGGFLGVAEQIVDEFLEDDKLILFTKNKSGRVDKKYATKKGDFEYGKVFVLLNENSASASEIIAGALQDNDKGVIVGRRSYGKGLVQREMDLGDGSAVRLTVSRYYTPTGRSIQRSYENGNQDYYDEYLERLRSGELQDEEKIVVADSLKFITPNGKVVYGGGGIIPDVFVPIDISMENETLNFFINRGLINFFVFEEIEKNRNYYEQYSKEEFFNQFQVDDEMLSNFQDYLNERLRTKITFVAYKEEIKLYIKAFFAEQLFNQGAYHEIIGENDIVLEEVLRISKEGY